MKALIFFISILLVSLAGAAIADDTQAQDLVKKINKTFASGLIESSAVNEFIGMPLPILIFQASSNWKESKSVDEQLIYGQQINGPLIKSVDISYSAVAPPLFTSVSLYRHFGNYNMRSNRLTLDLDTRKMCITPSVLERVFGKFAIERPIVVEFITGPLDPQTTPRGSVKYGRLVFTISIASCVLSIDLMDNIQNSSLPTTDPEILEYTKFVESFLPFDPSKNPMSGIGFDCLPGRITESRMDCSCAAGTTSKFCSHKVSNYFWDNGDVLTVINRPILAK